jgi:hypothetical protein
VNQLQRARATTTEALFRASDALRVTANESDDRWLKIDDLAQMSLWHEHLEYPDDPSDVNRVHYGWIRWQLDSPERTMLADRLFQATVEAK